MGVVYFILGIVIGLICLGLALSLGAMFPAMPEGTRGFFEIGIFMLGLASIFMGLIVDGE